MHVHWNSVTPYPFMGMNMSAGPPTFQARLFVHHALIRGSGHSRALTTLYIYVFVRKRAVNSYAIDKDGDLISAQPDIALLGQV